MPCKFAMHDITRIVLTAIINEAPSLIGCQLTISASNSDYAKLSERMCCENGKLLFCVNATERVNSLVSWAVAQFATAR